MTIQNSCHSPVPVISGIEALAPRYDMIVCDVWGVLHNGVTPFLAAADALKRFRARGGIVVLVSNAPRPSGFVQGFLDNMGVPQGISDAIVTSGDVSHEAIAARAGQRLYHIGPERDLTLFDNTGAILTSLPDAQYVVCTGLFDDESETAEDYRDILEKVRQRGLWMLCANPDLVVERGVKLIVCGGSVAAAYEELGGDVFWAGKPYTPVYSKALDVAASLAGRAIDKARVLAIGDAIRTDVAGAVGFGVDSLMCARGIHSAELGLSGGGVFDGARVQAWLESQVFKPTVVIDTLSW